MCQHFDRRAIELDFSLAAVRSFSDVKSEEPLGPFAPLLASRGVRGMATTGDIYDGAFAAASTHCL